MTNVHVTNALDGFVEHHWSAGDDRGSVSMTASRFTGDGYSKVVEVARSAADFMAPTADGWWVFDVVQFHKAGCGWPEQPWGSDCDPDALASSHAQPLWDRVRTAGVTDEAVFTELAKLHADEFEAAK